MNWVALEAIGTWVAALGTIAAVATALYLSSYQNKQKLRIIAGDGYSNFTIIITNLGFRPVVVQELKWIITNCPKADRLIISEDRYFLLDEKNPPPRRLIEGESLKIALDEGSLRYIIRSFSFIYDVDIEPDFLKGLKLSVVTPKESFEVAVEQDMVDALMEEAKQYPKG